MTGWAALFVPRLRYDGSDFRASSGVSVVNAPDYSFEQANGPAHGAPPPCDEREDCCTCGEYRMERDVGQSPGQEKQPRSAAQRVLRNGPAAEDRIFNRLRNGHS